MSIWISPARIGACFTFRVTFVILLSQVVEIIGSPKSSGNSSNADSEIVDSNIDQLNSLQHSVEQDFQRMFSAHSEVVTAAPGRVNLIGEHIDYNDGFVLPMAIERYVVVAASAASDSTQTFGNVYSLNLDESVEVPLVGSTLPTMSGWGRYLEGVVAEFVRLGIKVPPFNAVVGSDIPVGSGLSSSAAFEVAIATMLESLTGTTLDPGDKALLCQRAEHNFAGVPCGIMDQFASVFGRPNELMLLDCRSQKVDPVPFEGSEVSVLITNSNVKHSLADGEYARRRSECDSALAKLKTDSWRDVVMSQVDSNRELLTPTEYKRSCHVVSEIERTVLAANAFRDSEWARVGELMYASHYSLRDQYSVSCKELDLLVDLMSELGEKGGVFGSRMTGGGFGGCTVSLVRSDAVESIKKFVISRYKSVTGIETTSFASRPSMGAHLISGDGK